MPALDRPAKVVPEGAFPMGSGPWSQNVVGIRSVVSLAGRVEPSEAPVGLFGARAEVSDGSGEAPAARMMAFAGKGAEPPAAALEQGVRATGPSEGLGYLYFPC